MSDVVNMHQLVRLMGGWETGEGKRCELLANSIKLLIDNGRLPAGARMPSERIVASTLGVARVTASEAFNILRDVGALSSRAGVGTFVSSMGSTVSAGGDARLQSFLQVRSPGRVDLRNAAPPAVPMVGEVMADFPMEIIEPLLQSHGYVPQGLDRLIEAICVYYTDLGLPTRHEEVLVTAGAQQAVHLVASCVLVPGDTVVVEDPTFRGGIESLRSIGARLVGVPTGADGIDIDELENNFRRYRPRLALLMTTVHNPMGTSSSEAKRRAIGVLADRYNVVVVDDASTSDLLFAETLPRPMAAFSNKCITIGSASKSFWGGLRIGWIRASAQILGGLLAAKGAEDLGTSLPAQLITSRLLPRIEHARAFRRASLNAALMAVLEDIATYLPAGFTTKRPTGGASLWLRLPPGLSASVICAAASREGVDLLPGPTFSISHGFDDHLRIGYAAPRPVVSEGIQRLGRTIERL
jgi:DNA-binding transcriptional MocR family regulator